MSELTYQLTQKDIEFIAEETLAIYMRESEVVVVLPYSLDTPTIVIKADSIYSALRMSRNFVKEMEECCEFVEDLID